MVIIIFLLVGFTINYNPSAHFCAKVGLSKKYFISHNDFQSTSVIKMSLLIYNETKIYLNLFNYGT